MAGAPSASIPKICRDARSRVSRSSAPHSVSQPGISKPLFQQRHAVVAPEGLATEYEDRYAEDTIALGFCQTIGERTRPFAAPIVQVLLPRAAELVDDTRHRI